MKIFEYLKKNWEILLWITIIAVVVISIIMLFQWDEERKSKNRSVNNIAWKQTYPEAKNNYYRYCDKNGFLIEARKYSYEFSEHLVTADNDVPIRCRNDYHVTVENAGKTSTSTLF